jgi:chemotaxis protein MotB
MKIEQSRSGRVAAVVVLAAGALVLGGGLGGCNARSNELLETNRALTDRNVALQQENESLQSANASLQSAVENRDRLLGEAKADLERLGGANQDLLGRMAQFDDRIRNMKFGQLDPATDQALQELAAQYPDLIVYDGDRGMIRFTSDLTFGSGSAEVTAQGKQSLGALGRILTSVNAGQYDIRVVGHTDAQPIRNAANRGHPTNWHLSAHRSISVKDELTKMGVTNERVEVAGRGEFQPAVPNAANGNTPQNRRVEIYLVRATRPATGAPAPAIATPVPTSREDDTIK